MIIEDFSIPSAVILSLIVLKVKYGKLHFIAIGLCVVGITLGFINDFYFIENSGTSQEAKRPLLGDFCALLGAFFYALENVLQEFFIKKTEDVFNFLGFLGIFGVIVTLIEGTIAGEFSEFKNAKEEDKWSIIGCYAGMAAVNFCVYTIIPFYITRSGATLLNLSNVTTVLWSMLFDILLFNGQIYWLYGVAFVIEITAIIIYSQ